jgi:mannose-1-phosphate guanylyltransferase / phosphomannomutase
MNPLNMEHKKIKAIFLDRDGTINREAGDISHVRQMRLLPGSARAVKKLNAMGFLVIIVTNQSIVAHGKLSERGLEEIHAVLVRRLRRNGGIIDAIYFCPHHPKALLKKYRIMCRCRKPNMGMIMDAAKKFNIDLRKSYVIGDATRDILAGKRAKAKTILVQTGKAGNDKQHAVKPDFTVKDLSAAATIIKRLE